MSFPCKLPPQFLALPGLALAIGAALLLTQAASAVPPWEGWPWTKPLTAHGYNERPPATPPPPAVTNPPVKYTLQIVIFTQQAMPADSEVATVIAHLPEGAPLWVEGKPTRQRGKLRHFVSPPLTPGRRYTYTARVVWFEDGQWVSQTQTVPVWAGVTSCLFLSRPDALTAALDKLSPQDRELAQAQKFCAVQPENRLGAMGKPVKVTLKGEAVFLCCQACLKQARAAPERTLAKAKELRAKVAPTPGK
jgi:uncharacterized protein (TIGR03000 family)